MKVDNKKDTDDNKAGSRATIVVSAIGAAIAFLVFGLGVLNYLLNSEDQESSTFQKSVDCSYSHCGAEECTNIYMNRYPGGNGTAAVLKASEKAKSTSQCMSKTIGDGEKESKPIPPRNIFQNGYGNQANTGKGNNSLRMEFVR